MAKAKKGKLTIDDILVPIDEQPYEIPKNWCWTTLNYCCSDFVVPQRDKPKVFGGEIPWCRIEDIEGDYLNGTLSNQYVSEKTISEMKLRVCPEGTVICSCSASLGIQAVLTRPCCTNQTFIGLVCDFDVYNKFLFWYLRSLEDYFEKIGTGTTIKYISKDKFKKIRIPVPPLAEQKRIVGQIENLFSKLDEAKDNSCEVVEKTRLRKSAILQSAFVGRLTAKWRTENGIEEDSWKTKKIGDIVKPVKDKYDPTKDEILDIPYVGLEHIEKSGGIIGSGSPEEVKSAKTIFSKGDILYGKLRPYLDKHDVVDFDGMCSTDILVYRAENEVTARYINYLFGTIDFMDYAVENSSGINLPRTSEKIVSAYEIKIPSVEEQVVICNILDSMMQRENAVIDVAEDFIGKVDLMKKSILAKAFRGELGTNNPEEESSIELLKQILELE